MSTDRNQRIERLRRQLESAAAAGDAGLFEAFRGALALRPVPRDLVDAACRRLADHSSEMSDASRDEPLDPSVLRRLLGPSPAARDRNHPIAITAAAIRAALPEFQDWRPDVAAAATRVNAADPPSHSSALLPPGFADGQPAASIRQGRGLLFPDGVNGWRVTSELIDGAADVGAFREGLRGGHLCDTLELSWTGPAGLDLRTVQSLLERIAHAVVRGAPIRFAAHDGPRYRAALRMFIGDGTRPAADGGVLAGWPGRAADVDGAHVRVFLASWRP